MYVIRAHSSSRQRIRVGPGERTQNRGAQCRTLCRGEAPRLRALKVNSSFHTTRVHNLSFSSIIFFLHAVAHTWFISSGLALHVCARDRKKMQLINDQKVGSARRFLPRPREKVWAAVRLSRGRPYRAFFDNHRADRRLRNGARLFLPLSFRREFRQTMICQISFELRQIKLTANKGEKKCLKYVRAFSLMSTIVLLNRGWQTMFVFRQDRTFYKGAS